MATSRYKSISNEDAAASDAKLHEVELHLLEKIKTTTSAASARNYAEAYALLRGHLSATSTVEFKAN